MKLASAYLLIIMKLLIVLTGCAGSDIDRSYVNDPLMRTSSSISSPISPLTGLKNFNKSSGAGSCSVCAH